MDPGISGPIMLALILFALMLLICWIVLPFALIGTKPILRDLLREQQRTNLLLDRIAAGQVARSAPRAGAVSPAAPAQSTVKPDFFDRIADAVDRRFPGTP